MDLYAPSMRKPARFFFFSSRRRHTRCSRDWSSDVCSSDLERPVARQGNRGRRYPRPCGRSVSLRQSPHGRIVPGDGPARCELPATRGKPRASSGDAPRRRVQDRRGPSADAGAALLRGPTPPRELCELLHREQSRPGADVQRRERPRGTRCACRADQGPADRRDPCGGSSLGARDTALSHSTGASSMTATTQFGLSAIGQIFVRARDLDRAVRFYRDTLGMPFLFLAPPQMAFFQCGATTLDRKSTRLNSSHGYISYAVFCLKKKKKK